MSRTARAAMAVAATGLVSAAYQQKRLTGIVSRRPAALPPSAVVVSTC